MLIIQEGIMLDKLKVFCLIILTIGIMEEDSLSVLVKDLGLENLVGVDSRLKEVL